jgi:hypothetical protein
LLLAGTPVGHDVAMSDPTQPAPPDPDQPGSTPPGSYPPSAYPPAVPGQAGYGTPAPYGQNQYGQSQYPQNQYSQSPYAPAAAPVQSNDAVVALVLSIASWLFCPVVLAVVALVFASKAKRAIAASNGWVTGDQMATAAKVISWINIGLWLAIAVVFVVVFIVLAAASTSSSYG